jgi:hypothetical protein
MEGDSGELLLISELMILWIRIGMRIAEMLRKCQTESISGWNGESAWQDLLMSSASSAVKNDYSNLVTKAPMNRMFLT